jgi:predicted GIY-YIG superfamily endonuclease
MPFYVYILYSAAADKYYVGQTEDIENRLFRHTTLEASTQKLSMIGKLFVQNLLLSGAKL